MENSSHPMSRRRVVTSGLLASSLMPFATIRTQAAEEAGKTVDLLFVQGAKAMKFDATTNKLTLAGVSPITVFFSDRPERIAGNMKTSAFIPFWSQGTDSFKTNPPNADISLLEGSGLRQIIAELQQPTLNGDDLVYTVKILKGDMPAQAPDVSVFIDLFGCPLAAISVADSERQNYRRAYWYEH